jgi:hypothetical protein
MTSNDFRASSGLTVERGVKRTGASVSASVGREISAIHDQIESHEQKIKTLPAKFETQVKGIADPITKKLEVNTELFSQWEHYQLEN